MTFRINWPCCFVLQAQVRSWNFLSPDWLKSSVRAWQLREVEIYIKGMILVIRGSWTWCCPEWDVGSAGLGAARGTWWLDLDTKRTSVLERGSHGRGLGWWPGPVSYLSLRTCLETVLAKTVLRQVLDRWRYQFSISVLDRRAFFKFKLNSHQHP